MLNKVKKGNWFQEETELSLKMVMLLTFLHRRAANKLQSDNLLKQHSLFQTISHNNVHLETNLWYLNHWAGSTWLNTSFNVVKLLTTNKQSACDYKVIQLFEHAKSKTLHNILLSLHNRQALCSTCRCTSTQLALCAISRGAATTFHYQQSLQYPLQQ